MEGIVFVYIFRTISFAGHLNEYSQFACLQQLIRCFLFANVNESWEYLFAIFFLLASFVTCTSVKRMTKNNVKMRLLDAGFQTFCKGSWEIIVALLP